VSATGMEDSPPAVGALVLDMQRNRVGRVMESTAAYVWLRPPCGGREWTTPVGDIRPADDKESLRSRVAELNRSSARGRA
jgi:hypothetical protein